MRRRLALSAIIPAAFALLASTPPGHAEPAPPEWSGPLHGLAVAVPEGWSSRLEKGPTARAVVLTCETETCKSTQESCTITVPNSAIPGLPVPGAWLVAFTIGDEAEADILEDAREGSEITAGPETVWIGRQSWYAAETMAPDGWKSLYQATTVVGGRFVKVRCSTCDRSDQRFDFVRSLLSKVRLAR